jgi:ribosomal protein S9
MADAASGTLRPLPYTKLRPKAMSFWRGLMKARALDEWDAPSLTLAAQLAECQACIEEESVQVRVEGAVIEGKAGPRVNPRLKILEGLCRREMAMLRTLHLGGRVAGDTRDLVRKRAAERQARDFIDRAKDDFDDLLA